MFINIADIRPKKGVLNCYLWENEQIDLPLSLYYSFNIPLEIKCQPLDTSIITSIVIEWAILIDSYESQQEKNWKQLVNLNFELNYNDESAEGSIYLESEHCRLNAEIRFINLNKYTFDIELTIAANFNIDVNGLDKNGCFSIKTQLDFDGLHIYPSQLPSYQSAIDPMAIIGNYIDLKEYVSEIIQYEDHNIDSLHLKPKA